MLHSVRLGFASARPLMIFASLIIAFAISSNGQTSCPNYTIIDTRGTGEPQGPSSGFKTMNSNILSSTPGGTVYNTVYPASFNQDSSAGTTNIVNKVQSIVNSDSSACVVLEGYSQGASATVDALPKLSGKYFNAIKGVFLIGDPRHKAGLSCNVDQNGGTTTQNKEGIESFDTSIPAEWVSKTLDVCIAGDGICDSNDGRGVTRQHLQYPSDSATQNLGTSFVRKALSA